MKDKYKVQLAHSNNSDDEFDLDIQIREVKSTITGGMPPTTRMRRNNQTEGCSGGCSGLCRPACNIL